MGPISKGKNDRPGKVSSSVLWGGGAAVLLLLPFLGKPLHMDAPLIVWAARQLRHDPLNFYGVAVNWFGTVEGLDRILRMPPLFAALIAPFVNAERFLPLAPLVCAVMAAWGIGVLARLWGANPRVAALAAVATPAFVVCGSLVMPDMALLARSAWETARQGKELSVGGDVPKIWFEGHWGFQYYLEKNGARAVDYERFRLTPQDLLLIPLNNIRVVFPARGTVDLVTTLSVPGPWGLTVHHGALGAGFHSDYWGPLPLALGRVPPEKTLVLRPRVVLDRVYQGQLSGGSPG